jgi:hypothetical protein
VTVRLMSDGELSRLEVLRDMDQRRLTTEAAAQLLGLERRQVFRLLKTYRSEGATGLISKRRGRPSNRRKPEESGRGDAFRPTMAGVSPGQPATSSPFSSGSKPCLRAIVSMTTRICLSSYIGMNRKAAGATRRLSGRRRSGARPDGANGGGLRPAGWPFAAAPAIGWHRAA